MLVKTKQYLVLILFSVFLPSCRRVVNWGKRTFDQGCSLDNPLINYQGFIRSAHIYNQLSTLGIFDVLILTPEIVNAYNKAAKRNLKVNGVGFFVLAFADKTDHKPLNAGLDNEWGWKASLLVNNKNLRPSLQKCIGLPAEFKLLFGNKWSRFKKSYLIEFGDIKLDGDITLCLNSIRKKTSLIWSFNKGKLAPLKKPKCLEKNCKRC